MEVKLLVALGAEISGLRAPAGRRATVVEAEAEAVHERNADPARSRRIAGATRAALPAPGILARRSPRASRLVPVERGTLATPVESGGAGRAALPAFDAGVHVVGLPSVLDVTV